MDQTPNEQAAEEAVPVTANPTPAPVGDSSKVAHPGRTQAIIGIVCAVIALLFLPPVFGIAGIVLGSIAIKKGRTALGITTVALAAVCMIIGAIFGAYVNLQANHMLDQQQTTSTPASNITATSSQ